MDKKMIYIVVAVLVVVIVVGVAGVMLLNQGGNGGTTTPTPTPTPVAVSEATALQFSVDQTTNNVLVGYTYTCKNFNASDEILRVDMCLAEGNYSYIIDLGAQKSYASMDGGATWTATNFADDCTNYVTPFHNIVDKLIANGDTNADYTYTENGTTNKVYCIAVNPTIADSVFKTS
ncbi:MAG: hypothetical protein NWE96_08050 [Candidatus Bathyarchaeota archaeon]|nr:hypothetical protein [Candidatus Bathyarchaeota archaeon]